MTYEFGITIDQKGFPYETLDQVFCSPAIVDIDQDGTIEIIFGDNSGMFYILNQEWMSLYNSYDMGDEIWGAPAIDDLDGDGDLEISVTSKNGFFYIFNHLGNLIYELDTEEFLMGAPAIDSDKNIYFASFDSDGKIYRAFWSELDGDYLIDNISIGKKIQKGVALHDLNGDGLDEEVLKEERINLKALLNRFA